MIAYASRTGTKRNLASLRENGWRLLLSARGVWRDEGFPFAVDNGAWTSYSKGEPFDRKAFIGVARGFGGRADWIVAPDIVCGGRESLALTRRWIRWCLSVCRRCLVAVQPGITLADVAPMLNDRVGVFVGGDDEWKERTAAEWCRAARRAGGWAHVGRVNTARRIAICAAAGAHSFDGTSASRFAKTIPMLSHARNQMSLFGGQRAALD